MKIENCKTQSDIENIIEKNIPKELLDQHLGDSYANMAELPIFEPYQELLKDAEKRWFELD